MITLAALAVLAVAGVVSAVAARWTFPRYSDQAKVRAARRQIKASLYELRLFVDEPAVLLRAQRRLVTSNLRYLALMLRPLLIISGPMFFLMTVLDSLYGYGPITQGASAVVTVNVQPSVDLATTLPRDRNDAGHRTRNAGCSHTRRVPLLLANPRNWRRIGAIESAPERRREREIGSGRAANSPSCRDSGFVPSSRGC